MNTFIITQIIVTSESNNEINLDHIIRVVIAQNKETAIGIFVIETQDIPANKKLNINCYILNEIITYQE
jgi:hypothetical protein